MSLGSASRPRPTISWFLLILANVLWACSYVAAKYVLRDISANMMNALRMIISAMVLLPLLIALRKDLNLTRRDLPQLALLAIIGIVMAKTLEFGGLAFSTASDVALLITSESIFTAVLSWLLLRERFKLRFQFFQPLLRRVPHRQRAVVVGAAHRAAAVLEDDEPAAPRLAAARAPLARGQERDALHAVRETTIESGRAPTQSRSFTFIATQSMPTVSYLRSMCAIIAFEPIPSVEIAMPWPPISTCVITNVLRLLPPL